MAKKVTKVGDKTKIKSLQENIKTLKAQALATNAHIDRLNDRIIDLAEKANNPIIVNTNDISASRVIHLESQIKKAMQTPHTDHATIYKHLKDALVPPVVGKAG